MKRAVRAFLCAATAVLTLFTVQAQTLPTGAPAGTTVECKDGSFASPEAKSGACSGHKGIKTWFGKTETKAGAALPSAEKQAGPSKTSDTPATSKAGKASTSQDPASMTAAPGGGAGKVWVTRLRRSTTATATATTARPERAST